MAQEMREEDARNSLVYFTDVRDGKNIQGFGIDLGPGLPPRTRRICSGLYFDGLVRDEVALLDENHPLVTIQKLSFADFLVRARHILELARKNRSSVYAFAMSDLPRGVSLAEINFDKDADVIAARLESGRICHTIDWLNALIEELINKGITEL